MSWLHFIKVYFSENLLKWVWTRHSVVTVNSNAITTRHQFSDMFTWKRVNYLFKVIDNCARICSEMKWLMICKQLPKSHPLETSRAEPASSTKQWRGAMSWELHAKVIITERSVRIPQQSDGGASRWPTTRATWAPTWPTPWPSARRYRGSSPSTPASTPSTTLSSWCPTPSSPSRSGSTSCALKVGQSSDLLHNTTQDIAAPKITAAKKLLIIRSRQFACRRWSRRDIIIDPFLSCQKIELLSHDIIWMGACRG